MVPIIDPIPEQIADHDRVAVLTAIKEASRVHAALQTLTKDAVLLYDHPCRHVEHVLRERSSGGNRNGIRWNTKEDPVKDQSAEFYVQR